jgi:hypothetical protein
VAAAAGVLCAGVLLAAVVRALQVSPSSGAVAAAPLVVGVVRGDGVMATKINCRKSIIE